MQKAYFGALLILLATSRVWAMDPFEIQVYDNGINKPREASLEIHLNTVVDGRVAPDYAQEIVPNGTTHLLFETAYALTRNWEAGLYLQFANQDGISHWGGAKLRMKYIADPRPDCKLFYGINFEVGASPAKFAEHEVGIEARPIIGIDGEQWLFAVNPIVGIELSKSVATGEHAKSVDFEPAAMLKRHMSEGLSLGAEYYAGLGEVNAMGNWHTQEHVLFAAGDYEKGAWEFNFGIGRGLTAPANDWTVKTIIGQTF